MVSCPPAAQGTSHHPHCGWTLLQGPQLLWMMVHLQASLELAAAKPCNPECHRFPRSHPAAAAQNTHVASGPSRVRPDWFHHLNCPSSPSCSKTHPFFKAQLRYGSPGPSSPTPRDGAKSHYSVCSLPSPPPPVLSLGSVPLRPAIPVLAEQVNE